MAIRPDGRWGGQVTSRALPDDPSIERLTDADRLAIEAVWIGRAASERRVATSFELVRDALSELGAAPELVRLADRAVDDEHRHAELCRLVASRFAGRELDPPALLPHDHPRHPSASPSLRRTLWVVGHCLLNETTASAFLEVTLEHTTGALARAACRELLSDEIDHARLGWAHLAAVGPDVRAEVGRWLPRLARANLRIWRASPRPAALTDAVVAHGHPPPDVLEAALLAATRELIVPGCASLGLDTSEVTAWLDAGAPT